MGIKYGRKRFVDEINAKRGIATDTTDVKRPGHMTYRQSQRLFAAGMLLITVALAASVPFTNQRMAKSPEMIMESVLVEKVQVDLEDGTKKHLLVLHVESESSPGARVPIAVENRIWERMEPGSKLTLHVRERRDRPGFDIVEVRIPHEDANEKASSLTPETTDADTE